jgi:hypothetical protein
VAFFPVGAAEAVDERVAEEEDAAAREDPGDDRGVSALGVDGLLHEVEGHRADEHARAETHDQADEPDANVEGDRGDGADHQRRRRQGPPTERRGHGCSIARCPRRLQPTAGSSSTSETPSG